MSKRKHLYKRRILWPLAFVCATLVVWSGSAWYRSRQRAAYMSVLQDAAVANAFALGGDVQDAARRAGVYFQEFKSGKVVASNSEALPEPSLVTLTESHGTGILLSSWQERMGEIEPVPAYIDRRPYVAIPFFTKGNGDGYLVYKRVSLLP